VALVATMLPSTQLTALRTRDGQARGLDNEHQISVVLDDDQDDAPTLRLFPSELAIETQP
jgi:hypothetical protein